MQVYSEGKSLQPSDLFFGVIVVIGEHFVGHVDDSHVETATSQVVGQADESQGEHVEDRSGWNHVAYGPPHDRALSEIVYAGRM